MVQLLNKTFTRLLLIGALSIPIFASAEYITQENSAEANNVRVLFTKESDEGMAQVKECTACPLNLNINKQTRFFHKGKEINRRKVESLSGKPATVIYSKDGKQALRILW